MICLLRWIDRKGEYLLLLLVESAMKLRHQLRDPGLAVLPLGLCRDSIYASRA